ncbi:MAG: hypothetical protein ABUL44_03575, partial [Flavobacterium sp.]
VLNKLLTENAYALSGTSLKDGKSISSSATIDDKSVTINISIKPAKYNFFLQPTISGKSEKGFLSIFSDDKYSRTLTGGLNFQLFTPTWINFTVSDRIKLHNKLRGELQKFNKAKASEIDYLKKLLDATRLLYNKNTELFNAMENPSENGAYITKNDPDMTSIDEFDENIKKLVTLNYFSAAEINKTRGEIYKDLDDSRAEEVLTENFIAQTDNLQYSTPVKKPLIWLAGGVLYNNAAQSILDLNAKSLTKTFYNEYITAKISGNLLWVYPSGRRFYISLNGNFSNTRNFKDKNKKTVNFQSPVMLGNSQGLKLDSSISYFDKVAGRLNTVYFELPMTWYWPKSNWGIDVAIRAGINDPKDNNAGARVGIYVPVGKKDANVILIEPLFKVDNLFSSSKNDFFKDNFSFGFNLSVSLPSFLKQLK